MLKVLTTIIVFIILCKYRWEIFGSYVDWIEPHYEDESLPEIYATVDMETDYKNIKKFISTCGTGELIEISFQLIIIFQGRYQGLVGERMSSELFGYYEAKKEEMLLLNNSIST